MESAIRQIVSKLGIHVATKKLVCQEYCKLKNVDKLSSLERNEVKQIIDHLVEELVANPETPTVSKKSGDSLSSSTTVHENLQNDNTPPDDVKENYEISDAEVNKIIHDKYLSSVKDLLGDRENNYNNVIKKESSSSHTKKKLRLKSKDVINSILDSDHEIGLASPKNSPQKMMSIKDKFVQIDSPPRRQRLLQKKRADVMNLILDSESENGFSSEASVMSPYKTPTKCVSSEPAICEDSPLLKSKITSKKKRLLSDSESDVDARSNISDSPHVKRKTFSKRRRVQVDSDFDSESDHDGNTISSPGSSNHCNEKLAAVCSDSDSNDSRLRDVVRKKSVGKRGEEDGDMESTDEPMKKCRIVVKDCLKNSIQRNQSQIESESSGLTGGKTESKKKRMLSCVSDDPDHVGSSSSSDDEILSSLTSNSKKSLTMKSKIVSDISDGESSSDAALSTLIKKPSYQKPANEDGKGKNKVKQETIKSQPKKIESKELKSLRGICRHIGVILRNTIELQGCDTDDEKIERIKKLLRDKGMKGRPSMKSAEQFNLERELRELGGVSNDSGSKSPGTGKGPRRRVRRGEISTVSSPTVVSCDDFSHMKDVFCADDSSD